MKDWGFNKPENVKWKETFRNYIDRFARDDGLIETANRIDKGEILESIRSKGNPVGFKELGYVNKIIEIMEKINGN